MNFIIDIFAIAGVVFAVGMAGVTYEYYHPTHAVESITADLTKLRNKLLDAFGHHTDKADQHTQDAIDSHALALASTQEASAAARVADNL
jgi:hypothetical protein